MDEPEAMDDSKGTASSRHSRTDARVNSEMVAACAGPAQAQTRYSPRTERESEHGFPPQTKKLSVVDSLQ